MATPTTLRNGRGDTAGVDVKLDDAKASRRHLRVQVGETGEITIEDLGSANGTRVIGRKLAPQTRSSRSRR